MTHEEKIEYMRMATNLCRYGFEVKALDLLVSLYELVLEKEGATDLRSIVTIEHEVKQRDLDRKTKERQEVESVEVNAKPA